MSGAREESLLNSSLLNSSFGCGSNMSSWEQRMDKMYTYFYLLLFIPGLLLNTTALWVLCRHISKKSKAVIFMINLALADLAHILSLPLRIYYYFTHTWPFGRGVCLFCFYLKYLNMYAAIVFLVCISAQRCIFLLHPFCARRWRRRYDLAISVIVWGVVSLACSPFILMRSSSSSTSPGGQHPPGHAQLYAPHSSASPGTVSGPGCFKDLPMRHVTVSLAITMMVLAELFGFIIPLACISYSSIRIARSLGPTRGRNEPDSSTRSRLQSVSSSCPKDRLPERQTNAEKRRALRMVLSCSALFLICFAPYHINFLLYLMVSQNIVSHCATNLAVRQFHPVSLCLASLSCCLNPLLYYFLNAEFRLHLTRRTSSFCGALLSSPISSPTQRPEPAKLMSKESTCSDREDCGWSPEGLYSTGAFVFPPTNDTNVSVRQTEKTTEQISSGTARRPQTDSEEL